MTRRERIVVVGAGAAGLRAAERLRELDWGGELVIVGEERFRPYHRPALTKQLLTGTARHKDIALPVHTELDAIWRYGVRASYLEPEEHLLHLPGEELIEYDGLVIATGLQARHLPGAPRHDPRVHVLRTVADAVGIQRVLAHSRGGVAVIGGGFVGCEVASAARALGRDATIIIREPQLMDTVPGLGLGEAVTALHESHGVDVVTEASVQHWVSRSDGIALHLDTGQVVVAACVVLGVGAVPATDWLRGSGLITDDGVMCDPTLHAVGAEDIVVAGDIARWPNLLFDSVPRRVEHWLNAVEMGRAAAENLLAGRGSATPFTPLPRFWSEQHGTRIQAAGFPSFASETVPLTGSVRVAHRVTGYVDNGLLVGIVSWDSPRGMLRWTAELTHQLERAQAKRPTRRYDRVVITNHPIPGVTDVGPYAPAAPEPQEPLTERLLLPDLHITQELHLPDVRLPDPPAPRPVELRIPEEPAAPQRRPVMV